MNDKIWYVKVHVYNSYKEHSLIRTKMTDWLMPDDNGLMYLLSKDSEAIYQVLEVSVRSKPVAQCHIPHLGQFYFSTKKECEEYLQSTMDALMNPRLNIKQLYKN